MIAQARTKMVEKKGERITVMMKQDLPEIAGIDGRVYGPFKAWSVVELPYPNARAFVNHGDALVVKS